MVFRALGWLLLAMAVAAFVHDGLTWWAEGSLHLLRIGDLWSHLDVRSFSDAQAAVQRNLSTFAWRWLFRPLMAVPVLPGCLALGLLFLWLGGRTGDGRETALLVGARPRRRRRSRGLS